MAVLRRRLTVRMLTGIAGCLEEVPRGAKVTEINGRTVAGECAACRRYIMAGSAMLALGDGTLRCGRCGRCGGRKRRAA